MTKSSTVSVALAGLALATVGVSHYLHAEQMTLLSRQVRTLGEAQAGVLPELPSKAAEDPRASSDAVLPSRAASRPAILAAALASAERASSPNERGEGSLTRWEEEARSIQTNVEAAFVSEEVEPRWAAATASALRGSLRSLLPRANALEALECRASMCRVELLHEDAIAARAFTEAAFGDFSKRVWQGSIMALEPEKTSQGLRVVMYLGRPGTELVKQAL